MLYNQGLDIFPYSTKIRMKELNTTYGCIGHASKGNTVKIRDSPRYCEKDEASESHWETGKVEAEDEFESGDLPYGGVS